MAQTGFRVPQQSQAEKDHFLLESFHDAGFIGQIVENDYSVLAGRKGAGKTALARYVENKFLEFDLLLSSRISITSFSDEIADLTPGQIREKILLYIVLRTAKKLSDGGFLSPKERTLL